MAVQQPQRVFLDTWVLKHLARGEYPTAMCELRDLIRRAEVQLIITADHVDDFCADVNRARAEKEASFVDSLKPLWMIPGCGVCHREAYSEFLGLQGKKPLDDPYPCAGPGQALQQWLVECPCVTQVRALFRLAPCLDVNASFSREVRNAYDGAKLGMGPTQEAVRNAYNTINTNRLWARQAGVNWDSHFRTVWVRYLTLHPGALSATEVQPLAHKVRLANMPAWMVLLGVEKAWHGDKRAKAKPSDIPDRGHLAHLPYMDVFVLEANAASLIQQAKIAGPVAAIYRSLDSWLDAR